MLHLLRAGQVACLIVLAGTRISFAQYPQTAQPYVSTVPTSGASGFTAIPPTYRPPSANPRDYETGRPSSENSFPSRSYTDRGFGSPGRTAYPSTSNSAAGISGASGFTAIPPTYRPLPVTPRSYDSGRPAWEPPFPHRSYTDRTFGSPAATVVPVTSNHTAAAPNGPAAAAGTSAAQGVSPPDPNAATDVTAPPQPQASPSDLPEPDPPEEMEYEDTPLEEEEWEITRWLTPVAWDKGLEVGLNGTKGNADQVSLRVGFNLKRKTDKNERTANLTYNKAQADGIETKHNALLNLGTEFFLGDLPWTLFSKSGLEYDEFRAFDIRYFYNAGVGYQLICNEQETLKGRLGVGTSKEFNSPDDAWKPEATLGLDYDAQITERQKVTATLDYFPNWDDFSDFRYVSQIAWELLLSEEHDLSLKLSVNDRYDSTPSGLKPNDIDYALLLLWSM